jgi:hypothetical protein
MSRLLINKSLNRCIQNKDVISDFCNFCAENLKIFDPMIIEISSDREKSGIRTTAFYDPQTNLISVYGKNRAIVDICRSIAHEMTHMAQMTEGRIEFPVQDVGGHIEDEANAKAGELIKAYAKSKPERKRIYEGLKAIDIALILLS